MKKLTIGILLAVAELLAGCNTDAPEPQRTPPPPMPAVPLSTLNVTLKVPAADIARLLNAKTANPIADIKDQKVKCGIGDCRWTLLATRKGPIAVTARNNALQVAVPFSMQSQISLPGMLSMVGARANLDGTVQTSTAIGVGSGWRLTPATAGRVQMQNSRVKLGPMEVDLADLWNLNADLLSRPLFRMMDGQIAAGVPIKPQLEKIWSRAFAPIQIGKSPASWVLLQPERIRIGSPTTDNDALVLSLGVDVRAMIATQETPPETAVRPLPDPVPVRGQANHFSIAMPVLLSYDTSAKLALQALRQKPLRVGSHTIRIEFLSILPSGEDVVVFTKFCIDQNWDPADVLSGCGSGYLRGIPKYDAKSQSIVIGNLHYDVLTENFMLHVMHSLAGPALAHELEKGFSFSVARDLDKMKNQIVETLAKPQGRDITISGKVETFGMPQMTWTKDGFVALFSAEGSVTAESHLR